LPIKFQTSETRCGAVTKNDINVAVVAYKTRMGLQNVVTNYYANKYLGKASANEEATIIKLKTQLGFDDGFISDLLGQAQKKLSQRDTTAACEDWAFIRNIGSNLADKFIARYCN
jgi:hypothetical protein